MTTTTRSRGITRRTVTLLKDDLESLLQTPNPTENKINSDMLTLEEKVKLLQQEDIDIQNFISDDDELENEIIECIRRTKSAKIVIEKAKHYIRSNRSTQQQ